MVEKKKSSLSKIEDEDDSFEYVMKLEEVGKSDDHIIIAGFASSGSLDWDEEAVNMDSLHSAWSDYMKNPVLRYMHSKDARHPDAIGRVIPQYVTESGETIKTEFRDGKPFIVAEISNSPDVEDIRVKIKEGVLQGLSIGGRANRVSEYCHKLGKNINRIFVKRMSELSVVDLPANRDGIFSILKGCVGNNCDFDFKLMNNDNPNDSSTVNIEEDYQNNEILKTEEMNMGENIEMELVELEEFVKNTVSKMITDQETVEKVEAGEVAVKEAQDLRARIAELEAQVTALAAQLKASPQEAMKTEEIVEEIVVKEDTELDLLKAEVAELKAAPMYKAEQTETVEKTETVEPVSQLASVIKAHYGVD